MPTQAIVTISVVLIMVTRDLHAFWITSLFLAILISISRIASMIAGLSTTQNTCIVGFRD